MDSEFSPNVLLRVLSMGWNPFMNFSKINLSVLYGFGVQYTFRSTMESNDILNLPENIYTAAIILPFTRDRNKSQFENYWRDFQV